MAWRRRAMAGLAVLAGTGVLAGMQLSSAEQLVSQRPVAVAATASAPATTAPTVTTTTLAPTSTTSTAPEAIEVVAAASPAPEPEPEPAPAPRPTPTPASAPAAASAPAPRPAPAPAPAPVTPTEMGAAALQLIDYPWQKLGYEVIFEGPNPGLLGKANCRTNQIWVYVRPTQTVRQVAFVTAFELGHAVDCGTMDSARRAEWAAIRGFAPGWTWFPSCLCTEDDFGSGDISMVFATWLVPDGGYGWRSNLAPPPPPEQLQRLLPYLRPTSVA